MTAEDRYDSLFRWCGQCYGVDWLLLKAQVRAESNFKPGAASPVGAVGLAQFMPATWAQYGGSRSRLNPEDQIDAQARYMRDLLYKFHGDVPRALAAYNWGQGNVWHDLADHPQDWLDHAPKETVNYVARITAYHKEYVDGA